MPLDLGRRYVELLRPDCTPRDPIASPGLSQSDRGLVESGCLHGGSLRSHGAGNSPGRGDHAPNNVAKTSLIPDSVISRTWVRPKYGQGWRPRLDPRPRQAEGRGLGEDVRT